MIKYNLVYPAVNDKNKERSEKWVKSLELPDYVELCVGAQVVVLANIDQDAGIVNGTRGVITNLTKNKVTIKRVNGLTFDVTYQKSTNIEDDSLSVQYMPLKLAYAISIHRSQGMTLDAIEIDIGSKIFAVGQAYTALSRARDLKSVKIISISKNSFKTDPEVLKMYQTIENEIKQQNNKFVTETINMIIYNLANHINLENSLNFIWNFIPEDEELEEFFDVYPYEKLKLDIMNYELKEEPKEIKTDEDRINKLINMVYKTKKYMLFDIEVVKEKIDQFQLN